MKTLVSALAFWSALPSAALASAQDPVVPSDAPLFVAAEVLSLRLDAPFARLFSKIDPDDLTKSKKETVAGKIVVGRRELSVVIRPRGNSTLRHCTFPKLELEWEKSAAKGTPFEGLKKVDLGTHCMTELELDDARNWTKVYGQGMQFPFREDLAYRWARILGITTYATRRASIAYVDTSVESPRPTVVRSALFVEPASALLKRASSVEIRPVRDRQRPDEAADKPQMRKLWEGVEAAPRLDLDHMARVILFQFLIGNTDWQLKPDLLWNLKVLEMPSSKWLLMPEDFNLSILALGWKAEPIPWTRGDFKYFHAASKQARLAAIVAIEAKRRELLDSIDMLGDDPEGKRAATTLIGAKLEELAKEKAATASRD